MRLHFPKWFFSSRERADIEAAIAAAERRCSGEIRVHVLRTFPRGVEPLKAGKRIFEDLGMTRTAERNGVLFILGLRGHQFVVLGDLGIDQKVPDSFWDELRAQVLQAFQRGDFVGGLVGGIERCGEALSRFFPPRAEDQNELSNRISF